MDVRGLHVERRPAPDRVAVQRVAVGRPRRGRAAPASPRGRARERVEEPAVRRVDDLAHDVADALAVGVARHLRHRRDDRLARSGSPASARSCSIVRSATIRAAVRPERRPSAMMSMWASMYAPYARMPRQPGVEALGRVGGLELRQLGEQRLRAVDLVDGEHLVEREVVGLDRRLGDDLEDVAGDPVLVGRPSGGTRRGLAPHPLHQPPRLGAALGPGVVEPVVVALVAVDRRRRRRQARGRPPSSGWRSGRSRTARRTGSVTVAAPHLGSAAGGRRAGGPGHACRRPT